MENKEKILENISKLLKVAESGSGATEAEVENALKRVEELLKVHNLSEFDIPDSASSQTVETFTEEDMNIHSSLYEWEKFLLHKIADTCLCQMLYGKKFQNGRFNTVVSFCGRPCDIALGHYLYKYLRSVVLLRSKGVPGTSRGEYCKGLVIAIAPKLDNFRVNVNALVPVGLDDYISEKYPALKTSRSYKRTRPSEALMRGIRDGETIEIRRGISPLGIEGR